MKIGLSYLSEQYFGVSRTYSYENAFVKIHIDFCLAII